MQPTQPVVSGLSGMKGFKPVDMQHGLHLLCPSGLLLLFLLENSLDVTDVLQTTQNKGLEWDYTTPALLPKPPPAVPPEGLCFDSGHYPHWIDPVS